MGQAHCGNAENGHFSRWHQQCPNLHQRLHPSSLQQSRLQPAHPSLSRWATYAALWDRKRVVLGGVSDAVRAWCGYWGCSIDPFSQFRGNCTHFGGLRHPQSACVPCFCFCNVFCHVPLFVGLLVSASMQSPSGINSDHPEPTRKEQHPSRASEEITMTIQGPPGNNSNHPEPIRGNGNASRAHQVPFTTRLPVDHLLPKLFKYLTRCTRGADTPPYGPHWDDRITPEEPPRYSTLRFPKRKSSARVFVQIPYAVRVLHCKVATPTPPRPPAPATTVGYSHVTVSLLNSLLGMFSWPHCGTFGQAASVTADTADNITKNGHSIPRSIPLITSTSCRIRMQHRCPGIQLDVSHRWCCSSW